MDHNYRLNAITAIQVEYTYNIIKGLDGYSCSDLEQCLIANLNRGVGGIKHFKNKVYINVNV